MIRFLNTYSKLPERFFERVNPAPFKNPKLICFNYQLAEDLGMNTNDISAEELALVFSGQNILPGSEPIALAYAAHQFGHFVPQLGDGRAHLLGEVSGFDVQLKGSGQTKFSRNGDGKSALGPVIREYLVSEAMFHLGVSTTRALAAVTTGENVYRNNLEPGGVFTRVAPSHIRVGSFQYFAARQDHEGLEILLNYAIKRHYPELAVIDSLPAKALAFIKAVGKAQAKLIAQWMSFGFIHGVMNTDNFSVGGFTIDFGPCAFIDEYKEHKVFSSIDRNGRYSFSKQPAIGQWNLLRLVDCLLPLINPIHDTAVLQVGEIITPALEGFTTKRWEEMAPKFGITDYQESDQNLMNSFLIYLEKAELDFTLAFRNLEDLHKGSTSYYPTSDKLNNFVKIWKDRVPIIKNLNLVNPLFIPRNHQVEKAIQQANHGDYQIFNDLTEVLKKPYSKNTQFKEYAVPPKAEERVTQTFCGT